MYWNNSWHIPWILYYIIWSSSLLEMRSIAPSLLLPNICLISSYTCFAIAKQKLPNAFTETTNAAKTRISSQVTDKSQKMNTVFNRGVIKRLYWCCVTVVKVVDWSRFFHCHHHPKYVENAKVYNCSLAVPWYLLGRIILFKKEWNYWAQ